MPDLDPPTLQVASERSEGLLRAVEAAGLVVLVSHVNPDPDALASMFGLKALIEAKRPGKAVEITYEGMIARAENQAMVDKLAIPIRPIAEADTGPGAAVVMVDSQPHTGRRADESAMPVAVLDHHKTPGQLVGVEFLDIRPDLGATSTMVTGYLRAQGVTIEPRLATALLYGIESEVTGYPREAGPEDDEALVWLYNRADKDLFAQVKNPRLPQEYFSVFLHALSNAFLYQDVIFSYLGNVPQPDIISELADFFIRFERVSWVACLGVFDGQLKLSVRTDHIGGHAGVVLREVVDGLGTAGGHDKRAGGAIPLAPDDPDALDALLRTLRRRIIARLEIDEQYGRRLLDAAPVIPVP